MNKTKLYLGSGVVNFVQTIPQLAGGISQLFSLLVKQTRKRGNKQMELKVSERIFFLFSAIVLVLDDIESK